MANRLRVGVLLSGSGTNLQAILHAAGDEYEVPVVISDTPDAYGLERARAAGVAAVVVDWGEYGKERRAEFSEAIARALLDHGVELACSAGFMRILTSDFHRVFGAPAMNSHPALLPSFPGAHGVRDALAWGVKVTGATIHFLTDDLDAGPIILQEPVPVEPGDTAETLHERIKTVEHRLYPQAIRLFAAGRIKIEGRIVHVLD